MITTFDYSIYFFKGFTQLDASTKLLLNLARTAFDNDEVMAEDDRDVLEWLIDSVTILLALT